MKKPHRSLERRGFALQAVSIFGPNDAASSLQPELRKTWRAAQLRNAGSEKA
jgi:hypothetical protein